WHNAFSDFTIRLSQRLQESPPEAKLAIMQALQKELDALGAPPTPPHLPTPITPVESPAFDE
ncbi:hypothetical protein, partial [Devosia sp.]|uniref:hypothetical protein n=1 Tax=Devosia sp. TaxID=1871048 RepID=UPI002AFE3F6A